MNKRSTEQWQALFAEHDQSGLSAAAFCKERKLCPKYFSLRRKQLLGSKPGTQKRSAFVQAKPRSYSERPSVRLRYRNMELTFEHASADLLVALITKLP